MRAVAGFVGIFVPVSIIAMKRLSLLLLLLCVSSAILAQSPGYYLLEGKIGQHAACMEIAIYPALEAGLPEEIPPVAAHYYLLDECLPVELYRSSRSGNFQSLVLSTWLDQGDSETFTGAFDGRSYTGMLASEADTVAFHFTLSDRRGVERFLPFERHTIVTVESGQLEEALEGTMQFRGFLPGDGALAGALTALITGGGFTDFGAYADQQLGLFEEGYEAEMTDRVEELDEQLAYTLNHQYEYSVYPVLNTPDYLVMGFSTFRYTGGAHGMSSQHFYTYRKRDKKWLQLEDILDVGQEQALNGLLDAEVREQYGIEPDVKLNEDEYGIFIADSITYSSNFILSKQGITFHYGLYELTPYAYGYFRLFVPYEKLKAVLRPGFRYDSDSAAM